MENSMMLTELFKIFYVQYKGAEYEVWVSHFTHGIIDEPSIHQVFGEPEGGYVEGLREYVLENLVESK